jgi:uncharacterized BrkB/YihY/UPF0761 family membrane protein
LAGAPISLPSEVLNILDLIRLASKLMFSFFLTGISLSTLIVPLSFLPLYSRWWSLPLSLLSFIAALLVCAAASIATAMFTIFRNAATSQTELNIGASIGTQIFVLMWIAAACNILGFGVQLSLTCCCVSRRDVRMGTREEGELVYELEDVNGCGNLGVEQTKEETQNEKENSWAVWKRWLDRKKERS